FALRVRRRPGCTVFPYATLFRSSIYRSVNQPLQRLEDTMQNIASHSDLTVVIPQDGDDEITRVSRSFSKMMSNFRSLIQELRDAVHQSSTAAEEMNAI